MTSTAPMRRSLEAGRRGRSRGRPGAEREGRWRDQDEADGRACWCSACSASTQFLMTLDASVMNVSISALVDDLDTTVTAIQGVITAYTLVMAAGDDHRRQARGPARAPPRPADRAGRLRCRIRPDRRGAERRASCSSAGRCSRASAPPSSCRRSPPSSPATSPAGRARAPTARSPRLRRWRSRSGPIIGGFVTAYYSWRWVFAAEVVIAPAILLCSRIIRDVPSDERPRLDLVGALLSAAGWACRVRCAPVGDWGWVRPRVAEGPDATPSLLGISAVTWLVVGRAARAAGVRRLAAPPGGESGPRRSSTPRCSPTAAQRGAVGAAHAVPGDDGDVLRDAAVPTLCLGLDAFDTGVRMLPLSLALVVTAPRCRGCCRRVAPPVVQAGLLSCSPPRCCWRRAWRTARTRPSPPCPSCSWAPAWARWRPSSAT